MSRLKNKIAEFDQIAKDNGWVRDDVNHYQKQVTYHDFEDHSYVRIRFSRFLHTIIHIAWWDTGSGRFNVWDPKTSDELISISRIKHILRGTISPSTKT